MLGSDPAAVEDDAAGAVEEVAEEGAGSAGMGVRRRHHQDISSSKELECRCLCCSAPDSVLRFCPVLADT